MHEPTECILLIDPELTLFEGLHARLREGGYDILHAHDVGRAVKTLADHVDGDSRIAAVVLAGRALTEELRDVLARFAGVRAIHVERTPDLARRRALRQEGFDLVLEGDDDEALVFEIADRIARDRRLHVLEGERRALRRAAEDLERSLQAALDRATLERPGGPAVLETRERAAARPDGALLVAPDGRIVAADLGARRLLGGPLAGELLAVVARGSGLAAYVLDAGAEPRAGRRFRLRDRSSKLDRNVQASTTFLSTQGDHGALALVTLVDADLRRVAMAWDEQRTVAVPAATLEELRSLARSTWSIGGLPTDGATRERLRETTSHARPIALVGPDAGTLEAAARAVHHATGRLGPLVRLDCRDRTPSDQMRALFGDGPRVPGHLALARGGTLVLASVDDLALDLQEALREWLEDATEVATRLVVTTADDLDDLAERRLFSPTLAALLRRDRIDVRPRDATPRRRPVAAEEATLPPWAITERDPLDLEHYERKAILRALDVSDGHREHAAELLGLSTSTFYRRLAKHRIGRGNGISGTRLAGS